MSNGKSQAFPGDGSPYFECQDGKYRRRSEFDMPAEPEPGLTKRELFAAMAMQGLLACPGEPSSLSIAELSVIHADALISELSKGTES